MQFANTFRKCFIVLPVFISMMAGKPVLPQGNVYPGVAELRTILLKLREEKRTAFQNIKSDLSYTRTTVKYYFSTLHIVKGDTPLIAEDAKPLQSYYMNFFAKRLDVAHAKEAFKKWQELVQAALPEYRSAIGAQYPDLESMEYISPDGAAKFNLYRNGSGDACQVSISIICNDINELTAVINNPKPKPDPLVNETGLVINKETFARQLNELLKLGKSSFSSISGTAVKGSILPTYKSSVVLDGARDAEVINMVIGMAYRANYPDQSPQTAEALFQKLYLLVKTAATGFVSKPLEKDGMTSTFTFTSEPSKQKIEVIRNPTFVNGKIAVSVLVKQGIW